MKLEYARQIFETHYNVKFHENPTGEKRVLCGKTDGRKENKHGANSCFSKFCESA